MGACNRYTFEALWLSLQQFSRGVRLLIHLSDFCRFRTLLAVRSPTVLSVEVRREPIFFPYYYVIDLPSGESNVNSTLTRAAQAPFEIRSVRLLVSYSF